MRLIMHICCAPCACAPVEALRREGTELTGFWFNPNIHPVTEYQSRRDCLRAFAEETALPLIERDDYGLREFCRAVADKLDHRCESCYETRLDETARLAKERGFDAFTSSLFVSPYQKHALLRTVAERAAQRHGVPFFYRDFRPLFREGQERARQAGFYMQKYCGCIFSEEERYLGGRAPKAELPEGCEMPRRAALEVRRADDPLFCLPLLTEAGIPETSAREDLQHGEVYALKEGQTLLCLALLVRADEKTIELKNLVTPEGHRGKGYEARLLKALCGTYRQKYDRMTVGTTERWIPFYAIQGFDRYLRRGRCGDAELFYYEKNLKRK